MAATPHAMYQLQPGASLAAAFPQVTPNGLAPQDLDLLQIVGKGGALLAKVNYAGVPSGGEAGVSFVLNQAAVSTLALTQASLNSFVLTQAALNSFTLTSVVAATGVYSGTITGGDANAYVGKTVVISGFSTSGNNVTAVITASDALSITVAVTTQVDESDATAFALVVGVTQVTFSGAITGGGTNAFAGKTAVISGFAASTGANNGTYTILSSSGSILVALATAASVNETHAGAALVVGVTQVTFAGTLTGGDTSAFAGKSVLIAGFAAGSGANNGTYTIISSTALQIVALAVAGSLNETHSGTAQIAGVSQTTYTGTITGGGSNAFVGRNVSISGFSTSGNNVSNATVLASSGSTLVVITTTQANQTHSGAAVFTTPVGTLGTRIGVFNTNLPKSATIAQLFADAFTNPQQEDIIQVVNEGGNVSYYLNYLGVATGS